MKAKNVSLFLLAFLTLALWNQCADDPLMETGIKNAAQPTVGEMTIEGKTASTIELKSSVVSANGSLVTDRGFCLATHSAPVIENDNVFAAGDGVGEFSIIIKDLRSSTVYYVRPYAKNEKGITYGDENQITTNDGKGDVRTLKPDSVRATTALCGGFIERNGEGEILRRGVYFSKSETMTPKDSALSTMTADSFTCLIKGLTNSTTYYVQAFVTNTYTTFMGSVQSFKTGDGLPSIDSITQITIGYTDAVVVSQVLDSGDAPISERGFCWSTSPSPTLESSAHISAGNDVGVFVALIENLLPQQVYYIRSYAKNAFGTRYGSEISFSTKSDLPTVKTSDPSSISNGSAYLSGEIIDKGKSEIISSGLCYSSSVSQPTLLNSPYEECTPDLLGRFGITISNLKGNSIFYVRAYAKNGDGISYGETKVLETPPIFNGGLSQFDGQSRIQGSTAYFMIGNRGYLLGGDIGAQYTNEMWSYDASDDRWRPLQPYPKGNLKWQSVAGSQSTAYVLGGMDNQYEKKNDFYQYNAVSNMWYAMPTGPDSSYLRAGFMWNNMACFAGGMSDTAKCEVWAFNISTNTWVQMNDFPAKQYGGIALVINNDIYAGLGKGTDNVCNKTLWKSSDLTTWTVETSNPAISGGILAGVVCNGKIYVIDESYTILEYNPQDMQWHTKSSLTSKYQDVHCMYVMNNLIYIGLGSNSLIIYNPYWDN